MVTVLLTVTSWLITELWLKPSFPSLPRIAKIGYFTFLRDYVSTCFPWLKEIQRGFPLLPKGNHFLALHHFSLGKVPRNIFDFWIVAETHRAWRSSESKLMWIVSALTLLKGGIHSNVAGWDKKYPADFSRTSFDETKEELPTQYKAIFFMNTKSSDPKAAFMSFLVIGSLANVNLERPRTAISITILRFLPASSPPYF